MTREKAIQKFIIPAIKNIWNEYICDEIIKALEQEPCDDAISRQAYIERYRQWGYAEFGRKVDNEALAIRVAMSLPPVTPQQKIGRWEYVQYDKPSIGNWHCSECGRIVFLLKSQKANESPLYDYCPWCGAKMQEVEENG